MSNKIELLSFLVTIFISFMTAASSASTILAYRHTKQKLKREKNKANKKQVEIEKSKSEIEQFRITENYIESLSESELRQLIEKLENRIDKEMNKESN